MFITAEDADSQEFIKASANDIFFGLKFELKTLVF